MGEVKCDRRGCGGLAVRGFVSKSSKRVSQVLCGKHAADMEDFIDAASKRPRGLLVEIDMVGATVEEALIAKVMKS